MLVLPNMYEDLKQKLSTLEDKILRLTARDHL